MLIDELHNFVISSIAKSPKYSGLYEGHLSLVLEHAEEINNDLVFSNDTIITKYDEDIVEIAAISHDISKIINGDGELHAEKGAEIIKEWLTIREYPNNKISLICAGIKWHGGINETNIKEFEQMDKNHQDFAKIIMTADALAHLDLAPQLLCMFASKLSPKKASEKLLKKLKREWKEKVTLNISSDYKFKYDFWIKYLEKSIEKSL